MNGRSEEIVQTEVIDRIEVFGRTEVIEVIARTELVAQIEVIVQIEVIMADRDKADVRGGRINAAISANTRNARKPRRNSCLRYRSHRLRLRKWCRQ